jgi:hypothetical protein
MTQNQHRKISSFLKYDNNEHAEKEIRKIIPFIIADKLIPSKEVDDLYNKSIKH